MNNFFKKFTTKLSENEEDFVEAKKRLINKELDLIRQEKYLEVSKAVLASKNDIIENQIACNADMGRTEHEFHNAKEKRGIELAKLDAQIEYRSALAESLRDNKDTEIRLLKESNAVVLKAKDEVIELLKSQVEILTAKLTEIKITDAHINVDMGSMMMKAMSKK